MKLLRQGVALLVLLAALAHAPTAGAQDDGTLILAGAQLTRVVPTGFYFEGQSAPTQMRNSAAARFGTNRYVIAGLVDTSGYSTEVRAKYQGFLITDSPITVGGKELGTGAYGFGFSSDGKFNVFDIGGSAVMSVGATNDTALRRPRPLMMVKEKDGLRLYAERGYVIIATK